MFNQVTRTLSLVAFSAAVTIGAFAQAAGGTSTAAATPAAGPAASAPATTAGPVPTKVGVINIRAVIGATNEGRRDFEALTKKFEPKSKEIEGLRTEVETLKGQLQNQQDKLNDAERTTRVRTLEQKQKALERNVEDARSDFEKEQNELVQRIGTKLMQVVDSYAKQNNLAMVVDASGDGAVLWASEKVNISQPVLDLYNQQSGVPAPAANAPSAQRPPTAAPPKKPTTTNPPKPTSNQPK